MSVPFYIVEAFTTGDNNPHSGNGAGVCILQFDDDISDATKQKIANTINLSETALVSLGWTKDSPLPQPENASEINRTLRWFTPTNEVPLCGHATLASSFALLNYCQAKNPELHPIQHINFESKSRGVLTATREVAEGKEFFTLNFPASPSVPAKSVDIAEATRVVLGPEFSPDDILNVNVCAKEELAIIHIKEDKDVAPEVRIKKVQPDLSRLEKYAVDGVKLLGAIVTIEGTQGVGEPDFYSRFFGPAVGVPEDPVTGLAHTALTPFWRKQLGKSDGTFHARQASARGGDMKCRLIGERVNLSGRGRVAVIGVLNV